MSEENVSLPVAQALASALTKIEAYVPTEYVDNSEPDLDAEHLNHAEQGIMRVTNLLNAAVDVIQGQQSRLADAENKIGTAALTGGMTDLSSGLNKLDSNLSAIYDSDIMGEISDLYNIVPGKWYTYNTSTYHTPVTAFGIAKMFGKGTAPIRDNWLFIISINTSSNIHVASNINGDGWSDWKQIL